MLFKTNLTVQNPATDGTGKINSEKLNLLPKVLTPLPRCKFLRLLVAHSTFSLDLDVDCDGETVIMIDIMGETYLPYSTFELIFLGGHRFHLFLSDLSLKVGVRV